MEDTLREATVTMVEIPEAVLILVLMEDTLRDKHRDMGTMTINLS